MIDSPTFGVSIHAPVWGAKKAILPSCYSVTFQSTHPCGVRTYDGKTYEFTLSVSIHAPVWGANFNDLAVSCGLGVSIHAPVWGAKAPVPYTDPTTGVSIHAPVWGAKPTVRRLTIYFVFQSTHPCGVRIYDTPRVLRITAVSIHAPVWGANGYGLVASSIVAFQSTHPCGVRTFISEASLSKKRFNPRTRVGCEKALADSMSLI